MNCIECGVELSAGSHSHRKYCSGKCKARWRKKHGPGGAVTEHTCRICGTVFPIGPGQYNKWLCSPECRRASAAKSVREFHLRRPQMEAIYRARTKDKILPEGNLVRFYRNNPEAPHYCQSCGENRVLDVAHRNGHERMGGGSQGRKYQVARNGLGAVPNMPRPT